MNEDAIRKALVQVSEEAPRRHVISEREIIDRIKRRRTLRSGSIGFAAVGAAAMIFGTTLIGSDWFDRNQLGQEQVRGDLVNQRTFDLGDCDGVVEETGTVLSPLVMTARFPESASVADGGILRGEVTIRNIGKDRFAGSMGHSPQLVATKDGRVVTDPLPLRASMRALNLEPGDSMTIKAGVSLERCPRVERDNYQPEGEVSDPPATLKPGHYNVYVTFEVDRRATLDAVPDGLTLQSGPWSLELR